MIERSLHVWPIDPATGKRIAESPLFEASGSGCADEVLRFLCLEVLPNGQAAEVFFFDKYVGEDGEVDGAEFGNFSGALSVKALQAQFWTGKAGE